MSVTHQVFFCLIINNDLNLSQLFKRNIFQDAVTCYTHSNNNTNIHFVPCERILITILYGLCISSNGVQCNVGEISIKIYIIFTANCIKSSFMRNLLMVLWILNWSHAFCSVAAHQTEINWLSKDLTIMGYDIRSRQTTFVFFCCCCCFVMLILFIDKLQPFISLISDLLEEASCDWQ